MHGEFEGISRITVHCLGWYYNVACGWETFGPRKLPPEKGHVLEISWEDEGVFLFLKDVCIYIYLLYYVETREH